MKRRYLTILLLLICACAYAQKMPVDYYKEGMDAHYRKDYKNVIAPLSYLIKHYPKSRYYHEALFTLGGAYLHAGYYDSSITILRELMADTPHIEGRDMIVDVCEDCKHNHDFRYYTAEEEWTERHHQFERNKDTAEEWMYRAFKATGKYDSALKYLYISDTFKHDVGESFWGCAFGRNFNRERHEHIMRYTEIFEALGRYREAEQTMLMVSMMYPDSNTLMRLGSLLRQREDIGAIQREFKQAMSKLGGSYQDEEYARPLQIKLYGHYIPFWGTIVYFELDHYPPFRHDEHENDASRIKEIKESGFYKWFMALPAK